MRFLSKSGVTWPSPLPYAAASRIFASVFDSGRRFDLIATRANRQPAFGAYLRSAGVRTGVGLVVLTVDGLKISACARFEGDLLPRFGLPTTLNVT